MLCTIQDNGKQSYSHTVQLWGTDLESVLAIMLLYNDISVLFSCNFSSILTNGRRYEATQACLLSADITLTLSGYETQSLCEEETEGERDRDWVRESERERERVRLGE